MKPEKDALDALYEEIRNFKPGRQPEPGGETPTPSPNLSSFMDLTSLPVPEVPSYVPGQHSHNHPAQQSIYPNVVNMAPPLYSGNENQQRLYTGHQNAYHRDLSVTSAPSHRTSLLAHPDRNASTTDASPSLCPSTLALFPQSTPTLSFPTALQPPTVPIRLKPYTPAIAQLEAECARHDEVIPDGERRMGEGRQEARKGEEELRAWDARATLDKHVAARMGFAQLASERLQAVLGEKNDWTFRKWKLFSCLPFLCLEPACAISISSCFLFTWLLEFAAGLARARGKRSFLCVDVSSHRGHTCLLRLKRCTSMACFLSALDVESGRRQLPARRQLSSL